MNFTILGCGSSLGVPRLLCDCVVCKSDDKRNKRTRTAGFVMHKDTHLLIDPGPDFKQQALDNDIRRIDAVVLTHAHSDHFSGINDVKPFMHGRAEALPFYMSQRTFDSIYPTYGYLFERRSQYYSAVFDAVIIEDYECRQIGDLEVQFLNQQHGELDSLGLRIGNFAYCTDIHYFPDKSLALLQGLDTLVLDCLRYHDVPTHLSLERALEYIQMLRPQSTILTHMDHEFEYNKLVADLPASVRPAYDGLLLQFA
jgi:phosphoribosyl 1,2-cyclic phosphate phosphodiesterase